MQGLLGISYSFLGSSEAGPGGIQVLLGSLQLEAQAVHLLGAVGSFPSALQCLVPHPLVLP